MMINLGSSLLARAVVQPSVLSAACTASLGLLKKLTPALSQSSTRAYGQPAYATQQAVDESSEPQPIPEVRDAQNHSLPDTQCKRLLCCLNVGLKLCLRIFGAASAPISLAGTWGRAFGSLYSCSRTSRAVPYCAYVLLRVPKYASQYGVYSHLVFVQLWKQQPLLSGIATGGRQDTQHGVVQCC